jgi:hypothetical protein
MATRSKRSASELQDFVAHLVHPTMRMRTVVIRASTMDAASVFALRLADAPGWSLRDINTAAESRAEYGEI